MISVILCTYNNCESLKRTLNSLKAMSVPGGLGWELLIVDNNSHDGTKEIVSHFQTISGLNVRYVFEKKQGLSYARNCGVHEAKGKVIVFTDDDVIADPYWLTSVARAFEEYDIAGIGGRIFPIWEKPKPKWLTPDLYGYWAILDYGEKPYYLSAANIWGANFAVRADMFQKYGGFDTTLGRVPGKLYAGEDTYFLRKLINGGERLLYWPAATVYHVIPWQRISKRYLRKWKFDQGEMYATRLGKYTKRNFLGIPYYIIRELLREIAIYLSRIVAFPRECFLQEIKIVYLLGFIFGRLKY